MWSVSVGWKVNSKSIASLPNHLIQRGINIFSKPKGNIYWNRGKFPKADRVYFLCLLGAGALEGNVLQALQPGTDLLGFLHRQISLCFIHIFFFHCIKRWKYAQCPDFQNAPLSGLTFQTENWVHTYVDLKQNKRMLPKLKLPFEN